MFLFIHGWHIYTFPFFNFTHHVLCVMDDPSVKTLISIKNRTRANIYRLEKVLREEKEKYEGLCSLLDTFCTHDWAEDVCKECGSIKDEST